MRSIFYTDLHELYCQLISWTNWVNSGKFMDNCWISCQVMADMKKKCDYIIIINLHVLFSFLFLICFSLLYFVYKIQFVSDVYKPQLISTRWWVGSREWWFFWYGKSVVKIWCDIIVHWIQKLDLPLYFPSLLKLGLDGISEARFRSKDTHIIGYQINQSIRSFL